MEAHSHNICVIYRIFFKFMTTVTPDIRLSNDFLNAKRGETTVFQVNPLKASLNVPRTLKWDEINVPEVWKLEDEVPRHIPQKELQNIVEHPDGSVEICFGSKTIRMNPSPRPALDRASSSRYDASSSVAPSLATSSRRSFSFVENVVNTDQLSRPQIRIDEPGPNSVRTIPRRPTSPTESDMGGFSTAGDLYVLTSPAWCPDKALLKAMFLSAKNAKARATFFARYSETERAQWHEDFNKWLGMKKANIDFFEFLAKAEAYKLRRATARQQQSQMTVLKDSPSLKEDEIPAPLKEAVEEEVLEEISGSAPKPLTPFTAQIMATPSSYRPYRIPDETEELGHKIVTAIHPPLATILIGSRAKAVPYHGEYSKRTSTSFELTCCLRIPP